MDNAYKIPNACVISYICKTNLTSNTAFRGFGAPQAMLIAECWMNDIVAKCGLPSEQVQRLNLYQEGDITYTNQKLEAVNIIKCWDECLENSSFHSRRKAVDDYNRQHCWKKRGLAIIPTKFGISFNAIFLNQAGALVHIYTDGSVLLTHGGVEMGQGLHTKMVQVATYMERVSLSAAGFYRTPDLNYDWDKNEGRAYNYYSYGVACSEVEIDCLTGDHKNLRTDIVMDVGNSLNPAVDIGQVEGGFMQGLGYFTLEELRYSPEGVLYTRGPGAYKIPSAGDIPMQLNVSLLRESPNRKAIYSSK
ncbi:hypothetical protein chiPu_0021756, partial [Chiloscyllium punctatum]|nr:hypothetical protein [Chiloscyllium punctatum]